MRIVFKTTSGQQQPSLTEVASITFKLNAVAKYLGISNVYLATQQGSVERPNTFSHSRYKQSLVVVQITHHSYSGQSIAHLNHTS